MSQFYIVCLISIQYVSPVSHLSRLRLIFLAFLMFTLSHLCLVCFLVFNLAYLCLTWLSCVSFVSHVDLVPLLTRPHLFVFVNSCQTPALFWAWLFLVLFPFHLLFDHMCVFLMSVYNYRFRFLITETIITKCFSIHLGASWSSDFDD